MNEKRTKRARGEGALLLRGNVWWTQVYSHGEAKRESTGTTDEKKALKILRQRVGAVANGIVQDSRGLRYTDLRQSYFADYVANGRKSLRRDKLGEPYLDKVKRLDSFFEGYRAAEVTTDDVRKFIISQQATRRANSTINRSLAALKRMYNLARRDGRLRNVPYIPMLKEAAPRSGFFERAQFDALYAALPKYLRLPLALGYYTAAREGEILSLKWDQVDFLADTISLRAGETKNDAARTIPITPALRALLIEQRSSRPQDFPLVCYRLDRKGRPVKIRGFRKAWYSAAVRTGLGRFEPAVHRVTGEPVFEKPRGPRSKPKAKMVYHGVIFHDLRRSGVRNLVRAGVPERVAQEISGHKTREIFARYNITSQNDITEAGRKLAAFHEKLSDSSVTVSAEMQQADSSIN
jgi:integrase